MHTRRQKPMQTRTGRKAGIWLALCCALALHAIFLLLPMAKQIPPDDKLLAAIELQLTTFRQQPPAPPEAIPEPEALPPEPDPEAEPLLISEQPQTTAANETEVKPVVVEPPPIKTTPIARNLRRDLDSMSEPEKMRLTNTILSRQFFTEESAADQLFGKPLPQHNTEIRKEFHYPLRPDLVAMLDQPLPEVPFAYTADLVYFAYDPGVRGDLQRFWDVITPEFGWRTKYGTEVKCIMVLVIIGCGWK